MWSPPSKADADEMGFVAMMDSHSVEVGPDAVAITTTTTTPGGSGAGSDDVSTVYQGLTGVFVAGMAV